MSGGPSPPASCAAAQAYYEPCAPIIIPPPCCSSPANCASNPPLAAGALKIFVSSFSFKTGTPDANLVTDVRFLPDPRNFMEEAHSTLCPDQSLERFLSMHSCFDQFFEVLKDQAVSLITDFRCKGNARVHFAFGCTAGRHRSVFVAERLAAFLRQQLQEPFVHVHHREQVEDAGAEAAAGADAEACSWSSSRSHYSSSCSSSPSISAPSSSGSDPSFRCIYLQEEKCLHVEEGSSMDMDTRSPCTEVVGSVLASGLDNVKALRARRSGTQLNQITEQQPAAPHWY
jgi:hypothetical protein